MLDNKPNQPTKFRTKNWVEINDESQEKYDGVNQIRFKTSMLVSSLCDYSKAYTLVKGTAAAVNTAAANNVNKKVIFKNCMLFIKCISRMNNTQVDDAHDIDVVMPKYNLIEYGDNYSKHLEFYGNIVEMNRL